MTANAQNDTQTANAKKKVWRQIPRGIWMLGLVSLFMDLSSEMIHALLPIYMTTVLGASALTIGVFEGIAEATASITKVFSGAISDWIGKRKLLAVMGYGLAALSKPIFPLAPTVGWLFAARFIDRVGKGIRGAPRDALVSEIAPNHLRGACYGLRQSLDTVGAFLGPLLAIVFMWAFSDHFTTVFWIAAVPAFLSVFVLFSGVKEPKSQNERRQVKMPLKRSELAKLTHRYWFVVIIATIFTLARFSEAFLILRAQSVGLSIMFVPIVMVVMSLAYSLSAYPVGVISDRMDKSTLLIIGITILIVANIVLANSTEIYSLCFGVALWGLHMGFTQGLLATLVADNSPNELRATAFGVFHLITGVTLFVASVLAGALWETSGASATFLAGAAIAGLSIVSLLVWRAWLRRQN